MALFGKVSQPVGLDIGNEAIRVAQLKPSSSPILIKYGKQKTEGSLVDGEVTDVDALATSITMLWKQANITERRVILGISNQKVIVRLLTMPFMEKDDLDSAIQFQAQENIPIPIDETILDYQVINEFTNKDNERTLEIVLVAAQKEMVEAHIKALEKAKLKPFIVDVSSFALSRALLEKEAVVPDDKEIEKNSKAIGFIDIGESVTNVSIAKNHNPLFSRVIPIGENTFVKVISDTLGISTEEASKLKAEIGFPKSGADITEGLKKSQIEKGAKVRDVLSSEVGKYINEIKRTFEYGLSEAAKIDDLSELIVSGIGSESKNLLSHLKASYKKVNIGNTLSTISLTSEAKLENQASYAIAVGLAIRGLDG